MYVLNSNFSFLKQVGDISEVKLGELKSEFSNYPELIHQPGQPLVFKKGLSALAIQGDQITFVTEGDYESIDTNFIIDELIKLNKALDLPLASLFSLRVEATEYYDQNVMEKSRESFGNELEKLSALGVGYRFIVRNEKYQGDVYIEPYLKDENRVYFNIILQSNMMVDINDSKEFVKDLFDFALLKVKEVADDLYKK